ncbi:1-deoxy-D-xylulose-5-phosphate reductoisomerase [Gemmatimonas sp.]|uniref:1-deoxy-D-xylulose-5-phosphate reductoisomerase n=1 Tax=Gemmatimonas sp. TaxID=1962908 RepID=UPI0027B9FC88|nr:1-deoxy-D-xylulose-5-phosphate reductoisomerase [Gemmatimonas sp.]
MTSTGPHAASPSGAAPAPIGVALLGATGSIGKSALRVLARQCDRFVPVAMTANSNLAGLAEQVAQFAPVYAGLVQECPDAPATWGRGPECLVEAATHPDAAVVINAVVGAAGLPATLAALRHGKRVALANKETLVVAGDIVTRTAREHGAALVPVDSEHSAILQCLAGRQPHEVKRLILTASGGPFRTWPAEQIARATRADALKHPTWQMGSKITIDSATLANKALEVIEAHHLFGVPYDRIDVVVHPQSIIHSFVEFVDGSVLAQMGVPSMELPILYALTWPERVPDSGVSSFDPAASGGLTFEPVRHEQFPMLGLGITAGRAGGAAPAVFNAANEEAVASFLAGSLSFGGIAERVAAALHDLAALPGDSLDALLAADAAAREHVKVRIAQES